MNSGFLPHVKLALLVLSFTIAVSAAAQGAQGYANGSASKSGSDAAAPQPSKPSSGVSRVGADYIIGESDVLVVDVWKEKEISQELPVRPDGKISLPLLGDIQAEGLTPLQLEAVITQKLKTYLENPQVTVIVKDPRSHRFNVMGQVVRPGTYPLTESMAVLDALAEAGGFQEFAKKTKIYVLRAAPGGARVRIPFNYKEVIVGRNLGQNVPLKPGDTIVVP